MTGMKLSISKLYLKLKRCEPLTILWSEELLSLYLIGTKYRHMASEFVVNIDSGKVLSPAMHLAITWTNAGLSTRAGGLHHQISVFKIQNVSLQQM